MPDEKKMLAELALVGCLAENATCAHRAQHGQQHPIGTVGNTSLNAHKATIYCAFAFERPGDDGKPGALLPMYRLDPASAHQPDKRYLWDDRLKPTAISVAEMSELEKLDAEIAKTRAAAAERVRKTEEDKALTAKRAELLAERKRLEDMDRAIA